MKAKVTTCLLLLVAILGMTSCTLPWKKPTGKWESESPRISIDFAATSEENPWNLSPGRMEISGVDHEIISGFEIDPTMYICSISSLGENGKLISDDFYLIGKVRFRGDEFVMSVITSRVDEYPVGTEIVFSKKDQEVQ
jgi:hypothetical protein